MRRLRSDFRDISHMNHRVQEYLKLKSLGQRVGIFRQITTRIRSIYLGFLPFCILETFKTYLAHLKDEHDYDDEYETLQVANTDGTNVQAHDADTYDWDKHNEDVEKINEKIEKNIQLNPREESILYIEQK